MDLAMIWFGIIVFATLMYIVMDGFDLGIGILMPFVSYREERDLMVNSVAPVWDGNETWLVLGGAALFGAFPLAYAVIVDALTIPLTLMLVALIFRGVAFEFRFKALPEHHGFWDTAFMAGSIFATFFQGVTVGAVIEGFPVEGRAFAGGGLDWLAPFPIFCGVGLVIAYGLLGATWLIMKTEHQLQMRMYHLSRRLVVLMALCIAIVSVWTPLAYPGIADRWFSMPNLLALSPVPLLTAFCLLHLWCTRPDHAHHRPFLMALCVTLLGFIGLGISIWPHIIPPSITIWQAASPQQSLQFMLVGAVFIIPVILMYTYWSYRVFSGKVNPDEAYH